ncbi:MAG: hypothetical protein PUK31_03305 [Candidatus Methanomethylophilaceae archaeon]|nr:hypothetical protein [Candidatus Methanomethylophilaceae archaeon]MDY5872352.1 hypothetical protein [Candidatus Methanomethylophilaceae archaeon]
MKGQLYSVYVLAVLAAVLGATNLFAYISAGINDSSTFGSNLFPLILAICFIIATFTIYKRETAGWFAFLLGIGILLVQTIMSFSVDNIQVIGTICIYLFVVFYLLDDHVMRMFRVKK